MVLIAGVFAFFQALMPMIGWLLVHTLLQFFTIFEPAIPWIALALLGFLGGKMLYEGIKGEEECCDGGAFCIGGLLLQGVATSIDALSVGFTIAEYDWFMALICCLIIAVVTFAICMGGLAIGRKFGTCMAGKASVLGGVILILIGIEIFLTGIF
jgi:putative Mn2+ efflux pump MntP